jgi:hypothetical protein
LFKKRLDEIGQRLNYVPDWMYKRRYQRGGLPGKGVWADWYSQCCELFKKGLDKTLFSESQGYHIIITKWHVQSEYSYVLHSRAGE